MPGTSGWKLCVSLASCAKKIGSRPPSPIGDVRHVAKGDRLRRLSPCGFGLVMSNCSPVLPASWQPRHWLDVTNVSDASTPPAPTHVLSKVSDGILETPS